MSSFQEDGLQVYFLHEISESSMSDVMNSAFTYIQDYIKKDQIKCIQQAEILKLVDNAELTKKDIFVLEEFDSEIFKRLEATKALVIGPRCLLSCVLDDSPIPLGPSPVFVTAMRDLYVCFSGLKDTEKQKLKNLISYMGGHYIKDLKRAEHLYLVSNTIKSTKYEVATLNSIPVMLPDWINAVWAKAKDENILAIDPYFEKYKIPIFYAANISTSGLPVEIRDKIMKHVSDNGGHFQRTFKSSQTDYKTLTLDIFLDILITTKDSTDSDKYKAAVKYKKDVLIPDWIFDSITKGYALPINNYRVNSLKVSTPTKTDNSIPDFTGNFTQLSEISQLEGFQNQTMENDISICSNMSTISSRNTVRPYPQRRSTRSSVVSVASVSELSNKNKNTYKTTLSQISTSQAKKSGNFLDGCCIYLSGFTFEEKEKLNKILGVSGAHYYTEINDKITHIIVGEVIDSEFNLLREKGIGSAVVTLDWLVDSIKTKQPVLNELQYRPKLPIQREPEAPSPRSKKSLQSLNHSFKKPDLPKKQLDFASSKPSTSAAIQNNEELDPPDVSDLLSHYSQENNMSVANLTMPDIPVANKKLNSSKQASLSESSIKRNLDKSDQSKSKISVEKNISKPINMPQSSFEELNTEDYENVDFFDGLAIYVDKDYDQEMYSQMIYDCELALGKLVSDSYRDEVDYAIVSSERAVDISKLPVRAKHIVNGNWMDDAIGANALVPIQYYHKPIPVNAKKQPLIGMIIVISVYTTSERCFLEQLIRVLGATYRDSFVKKDRPVLVVPSPGGAKYDAAIKWGFPAVTSTWLVECAEIGVKIDMEPYLVGDTKVEQTFQNDTMPPPIKIPSTSTPAVSNPKRPKSSSSGISDIQPQSDTKNEVTPKVVQTFQKDTMPPPINIPSTSTPAVSSPKRPKFSCSDISDIQQQSDKKNEVTPLRHRRVSQLAAGNSASDSSGNSPITPVTPISPWVDPFDDIDEYLKDITDDAVRECAKKILLDVKNTETPELERLKKIVRTPGNLESPTTPVTVPEFCRTPEFQKRLFDFAENRWHLSIKKRKPDTPLQEIKMRLWRETLPPEILATIKAFQTDPVAAIPTATSGAENSILYNETPKLMKKESSGVKLSNVFPTDTPPTNDNNESAEASPGVKRLKEFIKNCEQERKSSSTRKSSLAIPNTQTEEESQAIGVPQRFESETMFNSERMVGWGDKMDFALGKKSHINGMQYKGIPKFNISSTVDFDKSSLCQQIMKLRGEICENLISYDPLSTHIVCEKPNRGEKLLSSVASGKWILSINYVSESSKQGRFIDEELYEWGNPKAVNLPKLKSSEQSIANAFFYWRNKITNSSSIKGAFTGFRVILNVPEKIRGSFTTVITAGDGIVLKGNSPYDKSIILDATHCLVDPKKSPLDKKDHERLLAGNVYVLSFMFISTYLTNDPNVDISEFVLSL